MYKQNRKRNSKIFKVMIVDDEPHVIKAVEEVLEGEGYTVIGVASGSECLKKLEKESVDLILMDFFMPEMDGRTVIEKIRGNSKLRDIKIAFLTIALFRERGMEIMKELGISDYITKPFEIDDFKARIRKILQAKF